MNLAGAFTNVTPAKEASIAEVRRHARSRLDYQAWIVDLDGTLYRAFWVRAAMASRLIWSTPSTVRVLREFRRQQELFRQSPPECDDVFRAQIAVTAARLGLLPIEVARTVQDWMFDRPASMLRSFRRRGLLRQLAAFRKLGGRTALVSDYPAAQKLASLGARHLFDVVVACGEECGPRRLKPAPDGLLLAAGLLRVPPIESLVIGDRNDVDGEAARRAGMAYRHVRHFVSEPL